MRIGWAQDCDGHRQLHQLLRDGNYAMTRIVTPQTAILLSPCFAADDQTSPKNYVLFSVKTDLQRYVLQSSAAGAYLEVNGDGVLVDGKFSPEEFGVESFVADLRAFRERNDVEPVVKLYIRFADLTATAEQRRTAAAEVKAACLKAGFVKVSAGTRFGGKPWEDKVAPLGSSRSQRDAAESAIDREPVRIFPVRTELSRFLLGNDVTCVVQLRQPIDGRFQDITKSVRQTIVQSVASLALPPKGVIVFHCLTTTAGRKPLERFFGYGESSPGNIFAREMGFRSSLWSTTTMGVAPEDLLGKQAPDFTLQSLGGGEINLRSTIQGRVAVISFWGVACGPCRVEAPHLSVLHNRYGEDGLTVIGVNSYDEAEEVVAKYVQDESLNHMIVLMGGNVAKRKYTVVSHPVTFFVDHKGVMRDYHLGFQAGDEKQLFDHVEQLLSERNQDVDQQ